MNNAYATERDNVSRLDIPFRDVEQFLFREAEIMDQHRFDEWLSLWSDDGLYWIPCNSDEINPNESVSLIYETRNQLDDRIYRLKGRHAHAQNPRSRLTRAVSNVVIESVSQETIAVRSNFVLGEVRSGRAETWFGRNRYVLVRDGDDFRIREKKVLLLNNDITMNNLTFLV